MRTGPAALLSQLVHHAMSAPGGGGEALALQVAAQCTPPAFAHSGSFAFLESLGLRSVVLLSIEYPSTALEQFCAKNHAELHHFGIERRWPTPNVIGLREAYGAPSKASSLFLSSHEINSFSVLESIVKDALQLLLDVRNHPVLVTDTAGIFETGTLLGCLRKMQGWNFLSILVEYRGFAGPLARSTNERFIEMFDTDLVTLPPVEFIPDWLLPPQQFFVDEQERSDSAGTSDSSRRDSLSQ